MISATPAPAPRDFRAQSFDLASFLFSSATGLATLDKIAGAGVVPGERGADDGAPTNEVKVTSVLLD